MSEQHVPITQAKQNLGELVRRVAYGGEKFVLEFMGKPRAAIISYRDLLRLQGLDATPGSNREALERLKSLGQRIAARTTETFDSVADVEVVRRERDERFSGHVMLGFNIAPVDWTGLHRGAWDMAERFGLPTAYDAHYLVVAEYVGCEFWIGGGRLQCAVAGLLPWVRSLREA